jgi:N-[(2S)-2-amino-2-carboxyethyl]-L-glutamate dehydrogenase
VHAPPSFVCVTAPAVREIISSRLPLCLEVVKNAYLRHAEADSVHCPSTLFVRPPGRTDCRLLALPASLGPTGPNGMKWIASYPQNTSNGLARASAVVILNCGETGYPLACLEGSFISAARTAASAILVLEKLRGKKFGSLGVIGTGFIARTVYSFLIQLGYEIGQISVFDLKPEAAEDFARFAASTGRHRDVRVQPSKEQTVASSEVVLFATLAAAPHVFDESLLAHNPVVLHLSLRDLAPSIVQSAWNVVDDANHVLTANTSLHLASVDRGGDATFIHATVAALLSGAAPQPPPGRAVVFSPFGLGVLDVALADWVYQQAIGAGDVFRIPHFFAGAA